MSGQLSLSGIREGAMNPPADGAAGYEQMLWDSLLQENQRERDAYMQSLRDTADRAMRRSGWYNVGSMMMPQDAGDVALSAAMGPGLGRLSRAGLAALGGMTTQPGEAEGSLLTRAWRMLNSGATASARQADEVARHLAEGPRVRDAVVDPTVQHYLDNMRNVLAPQRELGENAAGRQLRMYEDPIQAARGSQRPDWMFALNPQRELLRPEAFERIALAEAGQTSTARLPDMVDPRLTRMYPEFEDITMRFENDPAAANGWFNAGDAGWAGTWGGYGRQPELALNANTAPSWGRAQHRDVAAEELQHAAQWADNRIGPSVPNLPRDWSALFPEEQQAWQQFSPSHNSDAGFNRFYRAYPIEWEGGLAGTRASQRVSLPMFDSLTDLPSDQYWQLFDPRRLP